MPPLESSTLIRNAGDLWEQATTATFLDAVAQGSLPSEALNRWLVQDYHFADGLTCFQAIAAAKTPRRLRKPLLAGLAALDAEMDWFEDMAASKSLDLDSPLHPACRRYRDFLLRAAYTEPFPVLLSILFGVEASYLAAWSRLPQTGPYVELVSRWSSLPFAQYVESLRSLAEKNLHASSQSSFDQVLAHEREFWEMTWEG